MDTRPNDLDLGKLALAEAVTLDRPSTIRPPTARAVLAELNRLRAIEQRAEMVAQGRPARPDRHVALALSTTNGPSPRQAQLTASWILTGETP
jgi:hypothetical protein